MEKDEKEAAFDRALKIVSFGDNSASMLCRKLKERGFSRESAEAATAKIISLGYINESEQLARLIEYNVNEKLMGRRKLIPMLISKGYTSASVNRAIDRAVDEGTADFDEAKRRLLEKSPSDDPMQIKKLLYTHGF